MKKVVLMSLMTIFSLHPFAQGIVGRIVDDKGRAIAKANVILLSVTDSSLVAGTSSADDGTFSIVSNAQKGILVVSFLGYENAYKPINGGDVCTIVMKEARNELDNIVVTGSRIVNNANGYSFRPKGSGLESVKSVQDLLAFLPAITVTEDKIKLLNKTPAIYVNGIKITSQNELESIAPQRIENIGVDYFSIGEGVSDKGGVIRITTKKETDGGYSGYLREQIMEMTSYGHVSDTPTLVIDASLGKCTFNYYTIYSHRKLLEDATYSYSYNTGVWINMNSATRSWTRDISGRLNASYEIGKCSTIAISEYIGNDDIKNNMQGSVESGGNEESQSVCLFGPESTFKQQTVGKYIYNFDERGTNFEVSADYLYQNYHFSQYENGRESLLSESRTWEHTNMFSIAPKYTKLYAGEKKLYVGAGYQHINYNDENGNVGNIVKIDIPSAYINYSGTLKNLMYAIGVTFQHNRMTVNTEQSFTIFEDTYICPQANLMWTIDPKRGTMLTIMYQRGVDNMPYSVVNGYKNYSTPTHYTTGNPSLRTPSDQQLTARISFNRHIALMLMYDREDDAIYYDHGVDDDNTTWSKPQNANYEQVVGVRTEITCVPAKWWNTKVQAGIQQLRFASPKETVNGKCCGKLWWNNTFNFSSTFGSTLNAYWETGTSFENYSWRPVGNLRMSMWKSFLKKRMRLSLESTICTRGRKSMTIGDGYISRYHNITRPTSFTFSVTWNFSGGNNVHQRIEAESIQHYDKIEEHK